MLIKQCQFPSQDIETYSLGAGVLPFAVDSNGECHVLLGRERYLPSWKGSCRWSGFEGSRKKNESIEDTAVREFSEESLGVVMSDATIRHKLQTFQYTFRVVLRILNDRISERYHCTYAIRIPFEEGLSLAFSQRRLKIEHIDRIAQEWKHTRPSFLESVSCVGPIIEQV